MELISPYIAAGFQRTISGIQKQIEIRKNGILNNLMKHSRARVLFIMDYENNRDGQGYAVLNLDTSHGFLF